MKGIGDNKLEFYGGSVISATPFIIFVLGVIVLSLKGIFSMDALIAAAVIGLVVGMLFAKNRINYWDEAARGIRESPIYLTILIFFLAGFFGQIMASSGLAEGFVWLGKAINLRGSSFTAFTFASCGILGIATGTSVGTIVTMTPVLFPAGIILGANPIYLTGAILSGAAVGDHFAPVSDTTIISSMTQPYTQKSGVADIGGVVRARIKYTVIAAAAALVLYLVLGGGGTGLSGAEAQALLEQHSNPTALLMLIPVIIVVYLAITDKGIFVALTGGIISSTVIGLVSGLLTFSDFLYVVDGNPMGIITEGISGMYGVILIVAAVVSLLEVMKASGAISSLIAWSRKHFAKSPTGSELVMLFNTTLWNFLTAGVTTNAVAVCGPINSELGQIYEIHPYRRANITDAIANSFSYFMPWSAYILIFTGVAQGLLTNYPFITIPQPIQLFFAIFYPMAIWVVMFVSVITGYGREFEGEGGKVVYKKPGLR
jgi:Na+/H+ antiporter NhaC